MKHPTVRRGALVFGVVLVGASVAALWPSSPTNPTVSDSSHTTPAANADLAHEPGRAESPPPDPRRAGSLARAATYEVDYDVALTQAAAGDVQVARARMVVELTLAPAPSTMAPSSEAGHHWLVGRVIARHVDVDPTLHGALGVDTTDPAAHFGHPFMLRLEDGRGVVERRFDPKMSRAAESLVSTLVSALQVVGDGERWTTTEEGPDGPFEATYARRSGDDGPRADARKGQIVDKTWRREHGNSPIATLGASDELTLEGETSDTPTVLTEGKVAWRLDHDGPERASYRGTMTATFAANPSAALTLELASRATVRRLPEADLAWLSTTKVVATELVAQRRDETAPREPKVYSPAPPTELLASAADATTDRDWATRKAARESLTRQAEEDPKVVDELVARLSRPLRPGEEERTLIEALASARTSHARKAFARLLENTAAPATHRQLAASAATFIDDPDDELISALERSSRDAGLDEAATSSLLALGGQAHRLAAHDPVRANAIRQGLIARATPILLPRLPPALEGEGPPEGTPVTATLGQLMAWLDALGNAGGKDVEPLLSPWLGATDLRVRRTAHDALRFVPTVSARLSLAHAMQSDPDAWVRRAAITASQYHPQIAFEEPLLRVLETDTSRPVRLGAATAIARWGFNSPLLYEAIERAAQKESDPKMRRALLGLLPTDHSVTVSNTPNPGPGSPSPDEAARPTNPGTVHHTTVQPHDLRPEAPGTFQTPELPR